MALRRDEICPERERSHPVAPDGGFTYALGNAASFLHHNLCEIIPRLPDNGDVLHWFNCFMRSLELNKVDPSTWFQILLGYLNQRTAKIYLCINLETSRDYLAV
jgi:hypothetical protein